MVHSILFLLICCFCFGYKHHGCNGESITSVVCDYFKVFLESVKHMDTMFAVCQNVCVCVTYFTLLQYFDLVCGKHRCITRNMVSFHTKRLHYSIKNLQFHIHLDNYLHYYTICVQKPRKARPDNM